jgi:ABC-type multidrug transport system permease subunit
MYKYYRSRLKFLRKILEWNPIVTAMSCFLFYFLAVFYKVVSGFGGIMASILIILVVCIISLFIQSRILKPRIKLTNNIVEMLSVKGFFND